MPRSSPRGLGQQELAFAGVAGQAALVREGRVSATELVGLALDRIAAADPGLGAFREVFTQTAPAAARRVDERRAAGTDPGPLSGVPIAIKDNAGIAGEAALLGTGSPQPVADSDDELIVRLRAAGAIPVGLTHMPELALWAATESRWHGVTRNPWNLDRTPGGSSGGSAAAVAAGLVAAAHATDGLGSIRIPASACGLVGLKPTHGLLPLTGPDPDHWLGMSDTGFVTRSVRDTAILLDAVLPGSRLLDGLSESPELRIAVSDRTPMPTSIDRDVAAALDRTVDRLRSLGHAIVNRHPPYGPTLTIANLIRYLSGLERDQAALAAPDATEPRTRQLAALGRAIPAAARRWARQTGEQFGDRMLDVFADVDVLLTPTMPVLPVRAGELSRRGLVRTIPLMLPSTAFTGPWNGCGFPAMTVPATTTPGGLPIGMQLVGPPGSEHLLLALGAALEGVVDWTARRPPEPAARD